MIAKKRHEEVIAEFWAKKPTPEQLAIAKQVQESIRKHAAPGPSPSQQLIAERRAESAED